MMIHPTFRATLILVGGAAAGLAAYGVAAESPPARPNILLIFVDDLGYGELGCQGNPEIPTPHIDALAQGGIRCTQGYVTASYCSPSRAGLLTGRYQTRFGYELNPVGKHNLDPEAGLPLSERTLADQLRTAGYVTGLIGKWHLGGTEDFHPLRRGFDEFFGFLHEGHFYVPPPYGNVTSFLRRTNLPEGAGTRWVDGDIIWSSHLGRDEPPYDADNPIRHGRTPVVEPAYLTDALTREAVAFIHRHRSEPFFLYLAYNAVHSPMQGAHRDMKRFLAIDDVHRRVFAAMLACLDDGVGAVIGTLRDEGLEENTLIFFISDNGGPTAELTSSNRPLRGGKGSLWEGGIRVPFLVQWKGRLPGGAVYPHCVSSVDVFATASAAAGVPMPGDRVMDGVSLLPYLSGEVGTPPHACLFWRMGDRTALRHGEWKIVRHASRRGRPAPFQLYHLEADVAENHDLASERRDKLSKLTNLWEDMNRQMVDPVWRP